LVMGPRWIPDTKTVSCYITLTLTFLNINSAKLGTVTDDNNSIIIIINEREVKKLQVKWLS
jgi:hypothetical protein